MRIIAKKTLDRYVASLAGHRDQPAVRSALEAWYDEVKRANWAHTMDIRASFATASIVGDRVVFNIKGNDYRLVVHVDYRQQWLFIKWVGTHAEYDRIDVRTVQYGR